MNTDENLNREISRALGDENFSRRIAGAVLRRVARRKAQKIAVCSAGVLLAVLGVTFLFYKGKAPVRDFAGLDRPASRAVVREVGNAWRDTDSIINASFTGR